MCNELKELSDIADALEQAHKMPGTAEHIRKIVQRLRSQVPRTMIDMNCCPSCKGIRDSVSGDIVHSSDCM